MKLDLGQRHDLTPLEEAGPRVCRTDGCGTVLSRFNPAVVCAICSNRLEIGGARIPLPPPVIVGPRPPAPERPVLEGAVPLPGVVPPKRERTYAEMIAKRPAVDEALPIACAECGHAMPANAEGWLCVNCQKTAAAKLGVVGAMTFEPVGPEPPKTARPERVVAPKTAKKKKRRPAGGRRGRARAFDWDEAVKLVQQGVTPSDVAQRLGGSLSAVKRAINAARASGTTVTPVTRPRVTPPGRPPKYDQAEAARIYRDSNGSIAEVARQLGCSWDTARSTIAREIDTASWIKTPTPRPTRRKFDHDAAIRIFRETRNADETARRLGANVTGESVRRALKRAIGDEYHAILAQRTSRSAPSTENAKPEAPTPLAELDAELTRLELELDHITGELGRLYARQGAATKRLAEVIGLMAASARGAA